MASSGRLQHYVPIKIITSSAALQERRSFTGAFCFENYS